MVRRVFLVLGAILLAGLLWHLGPAEILALVGRIGWHILPIAALFAAYQALRAAALRACVVRPEGLRYRDALAIRLSGESVQALTFTGPLLAEPTKAWLLERRGFSLKEGFAATIAEYLICTFVSAAMSLAGLVALVRAFQPAAPVSGIAIGVAWGMGVFLAVSAAAVVARFYLIGTVIGGLGRAGILRGRLRPDIAAVNQTEDLLLGVLRDRPARFAGIAALEALAQACLVAEMLWVLAALDLGASLWLAFVIEASSKFVSIAFLFVPMQVGAAEGVYAALFDAVRLPATAGFALAFVRRLRTLAVAGVGLALLARAGVGRKAAGGRT